MSCPWLDVHLGWLAIWQWEWRRKRKRCERCRRRGQSDMRWTRTERGGASMAAAEHSTKLRKEWRRQEVEYKIRTTWLTEVDCKFIYEIFMSSLFLPLLCTSIYTRYRSLTYALNLNTMLLYLAQHTHIYWYIYVLLFAALYANEATFLKNETNIKKGNSNNASYIHTFHATK